MQRDISGVRDVAVVYCVDVVDGLALQVSMRLGKSCCRQQPFPEKFQHTIADGASDTPYRCLHSYHTRPGTRQRVITPTVIDRRRLFTLHGPS